jgi:penicillin amidase
MSRDLVAPTVFAAWAPAAYRRIVSEQLPDERDVSELVGQRPDYEELEHWLSGPAASRWDRALLSALDDAVADLTRRFGSDRNAWRWGDVHTASFRHPLAAQYDLPAVTRSGDGNTVNATGGADYRQTSGASFREIIDLADFDNSVATNVPGQSADPRSPHYRDLLPLWGSDQYFPLVYSRRRVEQETASVVWLMPASARAPR